MRPQLLPGKFMLVIWPIKAFLFSFFFEALDNKENIMHKDKVSKVCKKKKKGSFKNIPLIK
jgi:hypothetical protein